MNPYLPYVSGFANLFSGGKALPLGGIAERPQYRPAPTAPVALIFSPHPDDEMIIGGFALRLLRETGMRVVNVAVTLGSNPERQQPRYAELKNACDWLGFELESTAPNGLEKVNLAARSQNPDAWSRSVSIVAASLARHQPKIVFLPHDADANTTHIGTHFLVMDAFKSLPSEFQCFLVETEFWGQMAKPNLSVESSAQDLADLLAALSFHVGEVRRNPYHLRLPAWMLDNVRRGAEIIGGQGALAPEFVFATLYRLRQWRRGQMEEVNPSVRQLGLGEDPGSVFGSIQ
jgi:LmbE family N-acetylglucosaminyl deacetylase